MPTGPLPARHVAHLAALLALFASPVRAQGAAEWGPDQEQVWEAVQARWQAWAEDDLDGYLAVHHGGWRRWSLSTDSLQGREDVAGFWRSSKRGEEMFSFRLEPTAIEVFGDGRFAAAHYVAHESVRLLEPVTAPSGQTVPAGTEAVLPVRFSDFMVYEGGRWLYVGGYRDGSCALFPGFGRPCRVRE